MIRESTTNLRRMQKFVPLAAAFMLCAIAIPAAYADDPRPAPKYDPASVERGQSVFVSTCGFCHGVHAKGGEKGPDLLRSVLVLDDENGKSIGKVILKGRPDKGMPKFVMTDLQIADIANFLHNSILGAANRDEYKILNIVTGDKAAGEAYFNGAGKCSSCHSVTGDLKGIGAKYEPVTLQDKFLSPGYQPGIFKVTVTLPSGESFTGNPIVLDDFNVSLRDAAGNFHSFTRHNDVPKVEIKNKLEFHLDMLMHYRDSDIHNLTAYLVTLK